MTGTLSTSRQKVGILCNPRSGRIRHYIVRIRELAGSLDDAMYREASDESGFSAVLDEFAQCQLDLLVVIAGDGTVHAVLTCIFGRQLFSSAPLLAIVPAGTTNMTANDFRAFGKPHKALARLLVKLKRPDSLSCITRPVLCIRNGDNSPRYGMFFGAGMIAEGVDYFQRHVKALGITGEKASAIVLLRYLVSLLAGKQTRTIKDAAIHLQTGQEEGRDEDCLVILATSLDRLLLGLRPYWGMEKGAIHFTHVRQSPRRLWRALLPLLTGRGAGLLVADGYNSHNLQDLHITMHGDYVIDGELYRADRERGAVHISAEETVSIIDLST